MDPDGAAAGAWPVGAGVCCVGDGWVAGGCTVCGDDVAGAGCCGCPAGVEDGAVLGLAVGCWLLGVVVCVWPLAQAMAAVNSSPMISTSARLHISLVLMLALLPLLSSMSAGEPPSCLVSQAAAGTVLHRRIRGKRGEHLGGAGLLLTAFGASPGRAGEQCPCRPRTGGPTVRISTLAAASPQPVAQELDELPRWLQPQVGMCGPVLRLDQYA